MKNTIVNNTTATLHILNASAREQAALLQRFLRCASCGDSLLLIENGVYNLADTDSLAAIKAAGLALYCLQADVLARGLKNYEHSGVTTVDDNGFVELTCSHQKVISWFV
jgi:tRNA 2-thiouridine synthesizing protein B